MKEEAAGIWEARDTVVDLGGKTQQRLGLWAGLSKGLGFRERPRAEKWSEVFV